MSGTSSTVIYLPDDPAERRRVLRAVPPRDEECAVPGCTHGRVTADCCCWHSFTGSGRTNAIPNDGIIDWLAIDVASRGLRKVRLTWVEKDIAVGIIFARGGGIEQAEELISARVTSAQNSRRVQAARKIAEAIKATGGVPSA